MKEAPAGTHENPKSGSPVQSWPCGHSQANRVASSKCPTCGAEAEVAEAAPAETPDATDTQGPED